MRVEKCSLITVQKAKHFISKQKKVSVKNVSLRNWELWFKRSASQISTYKKNPPVFTEGLWAHLGSNQGPKDYESSTLTS